MNFEKDYLKGTFFKMDQEYVESLLEMIRALKLKGLYTIQFVNGETVYTFDEGIIDSNRLTGKEISLKEIIEAWKSSSKSNIKIFNNALVKTKSGKVYRIVNCSGDLYAYLPSKEELILADESFLNSVVEVRNGAGVYPLPLCSEFETYSVVYKTGSTVFFGLSYQASTFSKLRAYSKLTSIEKREDILEWDRNKTETDNYNVIKNCDKLYILAPDSFSRDRIIGKGLYSEIANFMIGNHSLNDVKILYINSDNEMEIASINAVRKLSLPVEDYIQYATVELK